jgi:hypothetical protein
MATDDDEYSGPIVYVPVIKGKTGAVFATSAAHVVVENYETKHVEVCEAIVDPVLLSDSLLVALVHILEKTESDD